MKHLFGAALLILLSFQRAHADPVGETHRVTIEKMASFATRSVVANCASLSGIPQRKTWSSSHWSSAHRTSPSSKSGQSHWTRLSPTAGRVRSFFYRMVSAVAPASWVGSGSPWPAPAMW